MRLPEKHQVAESEGMIWVITGVPLRAPLRPVKIKTVASDSKEAEKESTEVTTPKEKEARIPERLQCPPAPKKQKPSVRCSLNGVQFFNPPDLNSVYVPHVEKTNQV